MGNDTSAIILKAQQYCTLEKHDFFRSQVESLIRNNSFDELNDRFYTDLVFGTGGLRGVIGGGFNRMNPYTVQRATQGLANYIKKNAPVNPSAVIAYDSRNYSDLFALESAKVLCGNGITTYLYTSLRSTPQLSFSVRHLKATAGIVLTASHNPAEYNGYKVYWSDGGQIIAPHDTGIVAEARNVSRIDVMNKDEAINRGLLVMIDKNLDDAFIAMVKRQALRPQLIRTAGKSLKVVYTPLHGTGAMPVARALSEMGIDVLFVPEQKEPDGNFPTVKFPNPEEADAMQMALALARLKKADLVMGTDPDADRLGIAVPDKDNYRLITGNQLGALLADYLFSSRKELGTLPAKSAFVKTIVTTELQRRIAESYGATCFDVLTGFKYIGEKIRQFENGSEGLTYIFGGEESYGYLIETEARDKDAVSAATMTAEMALYHLSHGRTLLDALNDIYLSFGYFQETLISKYFKGQSGMETMTALMERLRKDPPRTIGLEHIVTVKDYRDGTVLDSIGGNRTKSLHLPSSNVLQFVSAEGAVITARPSGTEPKIKFYASCGGQPGSEPASETTTVQKRVAAISQAINQLLLG
jgi:phosphoglucomutase